MMKKFALFKKFVVSSCVLMDSSKSTVLSCVSSPKPRLRQPTTDGLIVCPADLKITVMLLAVTVAKMDAGVEIDFSIFD